MLFKAPGKANSNQYYAQQQFQNTYDFNQKSGLAYNNSFSIGQKCSSQEKISRNGDQRFFNFQSPVYPLKTQQKTNFQDERLKQVPMMRANTYTQFSRPPIPRESTITSPIQQQNLILRKQNSQLAEKMRRAQEQIQAKQNIIRVKHKQIQQLKYNAPQSMGNKSPNDTIATLKGEKQKLFFQVVELQMQYHKLQQSFEKMQKQYYGVCQKYDELSNKSNLELSRKIKRQEMLQTELSFSQNRNERIKTQYERQLTNLKQKIRDLEDESTKGNKSAVMSYNISAFSENYNSTKSQPQIETSKIDLQRLQEQINRKNDRIKYLQSQYMKQYKKNQYQRHSENEANMGNLYEQCRKQLVKSLKQLDLTKKQNSSLINKLGNGEKMRGQLIEKIKQLQTLLIQVRDKLFRSIEQNKTINKRQKQNCGKAEKRVQELEEELRRQSIKPMKDYEQKQRKLQKMLNQTHQKHHQQLIAKQQQIKQYSREKQTLLEKIKNYQIMIQQKQAICFENEELKSRIQLFENQRRNTSERLSLQLNFNIQSLEKQLKTKTQYSSKLQLKLLKLDNQVTALKKKLEEQLNSQSESKTNLQKQKKALEMEIIKLMEQIQTLKTYIGEKSNQEEKNKKLIEEHEKSSLNDTIQIQNQKEKYKTLDEKYKKVKQQKKQIKNLSERMKEKISELQERLEKMNKNKLSQKQDEDLLQKDLEEITKELSTKQAIIFNLEVQLAEKNVRNEGLTSEVSQKQGIIASLKKQLNGYKLQIENVQIQKDKKQQQMEISLLNQMSRKQSNYKQNIQKQEELIKKLKSQIERLNNKHEEVFRDRIYKQQQLAIKQKQLNDEKNKSSAEREKYSEKISKLDKEIMGYKKKYETTLKDRSVNDESAKKLSVELQQLREKSKEMEKQLKDKQQNLSKVQVSLAEQTLKNQHLMLNQTSGQQKADKLHQQIKQKQKNTQRFVQENRRLSEQIDRLYKEMIQKKTEIESMNKEKLIKQQLVFMLESSIAEHCTKFQNCLKQKQLLSTKYDEIANTKSIQEETIHELQLKLKKVEQEIQSKTESSINENSIVIEQLSLKLQKKQKQLIQKQEIIKVKEAQLVKLEQYEKHNKTLESQLKQYENNNKTLGSQVKQYENNNKTLGSQVKQYEKQNKLLESQLKQNENILQITMRQYQTKIINEAKILQQKQEQIYSLKLKLEEEEEKQSYHRKSLEEKDQYNRSIQTQLQELAIELIQIKAKLEYFQNKHKIAVEAEDQQKISNPNMKLSKLSAASGDSFTGDYIEIDKNALLYICDLLGIKADDGQILITIIQYLKRSNILVVQENYYEILELFGVNQDITDKTQAKLIRQINTFKQTISNLVEKTRILELGNNSLYKENRQLVQQINQIQSNRSRFTQLEELIKVLGQQSMRIRVAHLNYKIKERENDNKQ